MPGQNEKKNVSGNFFIAEREHFFIKVSQRSAYICEKIVFIRVSQSAAIDYVKFSLVPTEIMHVYLFWFYFLWWVKIRKNKTKKGLNFFVWEFLFYICEKNVFIKVSQRPAKTLKNNLFLRWFFMIKKWEKIGR